jgi:hypothetical protein
MARYHRLDVGPAGVIMPGNKSIMISTDGRCARCYHFLTGLGWSGICPECGSAFEVRPKEPSQWFQISTKTIVMLAMILLPVCLLLVANFFILGPVFQNNEIDPFDAAEMFMKLWTVAAALCLLAFFVMLVMRKGSVLLCLALSGVIGLSVLAFAWNAFVWFAVAASV